MEKQMKKKKGKSVVSRNVVCSSLPQELRDFCYQLKDREEASQFLNAIECYSLNLPNFILNPS